MRGLHQGSRRPRPPLPAPGSPRTDWTGPCRKSTAQSRDGTSARCRRWKAEFGRSELGSEQPGGTCAGERRGRLVIDVIEEDANDNDPYDRSRMHNIQYIYCVRSSTHACGWCTCLLHKADGTPDAKCRDFGGAIRVQELHMFWICHLLRYMLRSLSDRVVDCRLLTAGLSIVPERPPHPKDTTYRHRCMLPW